MTPHFLPSCAARPLVPPSLGRYTLAEFSANNHASDTTSVSPFLVNYGYHPRANLDLKPLVLTPEAPPLSCTALATNKASAFASHMSSLLETLRNKMTMAQANYKLHANASRTPAPRYFPGNLVWLSTKNLRVQRPSWKLLPRFVGPFHVSASVGSHAYRLDLPRKYSRVHPVFHVSSLRPAATDPLDGQKLPAPVPEIIDCEQEWEVEAVFNSKRSRNKLYYYVQWFGDLAEYSWEPATNLVNAPDLIAAFYKGYPSKPQPLDKELTGVHPSLKGGVLSQFDPGSSRSCLAPPSSSASALHSSTLR